MHSTDPDYIVERLTWLLEDLLTDDRGLSARELRNVLAGRRLGDDPVDAEAAA